jgi:signal transduction histidine kinase
MNDTKIEELVAALQKERETNGALTKLILHDLANPLAIISSYLEMINSGRIPPEDIKLTLDKIKSNTHSALELIQGIRSDIQAKECLKKS